MPQAIQDQVEQGALAPATAYEVSKVEDPDQQQALARRAVAENLSRAEVIEAVRQASSRSAVKGRTHRQGKGRGEAQRLKRKIVRTPTAKVTIELRKGAGEAAILAALHDATRQLEAMLAGTEPGQAA